MGLDASVMCNCFQEGKTKKPPFPQDWLEVDSEGYFNLLKEHDTDANYFRFNEWEKDCCPHGDLEFASERISNWGGYRLFQTALREIGLEHFPALQAELPNVNGGLTQPTACALALQELEFFQSVNEYGTKTVLFNSKTAEFLQEHIEVYGGIFIMYGGSGIEVGLDEDCLYVVDSNKIRLFESKRFKQYRKCGEPIGEGYYSEHDVVWEDVATGKIFKSGHAISGKQIPWENGKWENKQGRCRFEYPAEFHVGHHPKLTSDFDDIVKALKIVFEASVETGNPVRWT